MKKLIFTLLFFQNFIAAYSQVIIDQPQISQCGNFITNDPDAFLHNSDVLKCLIENEVLIELSGQGSIFIKHTLIDLFHDLTFNSNREIKFVRYIDDFVDDNDIDRMLHIKSSNVSITFNDVHFDGNIFNLNSLPEDYCVQGDGNDSQFNTFSSLLLFKGAYVSGMSRAEIFLNDCSFVNNSGDGVLLLRNTNSEIIDCFAKDCARGGIVMTEGNSDLLLRGYTAESDHFRTGFDIEIDTPGAGDSWFTNVTIEESTIDGSFDLIVKHGLVTINDVTVHNGPFYVGGFGLNVNHNVSYNITDSDFYLSPSKKNTIIWPRDVTFTRCTFTSILNEDPQCLADPDQYAPSCPTINYFGSSKLNPNTFLTEGHLTFDDCTFDTQIEDEFVTAGVSMNNRRHFIDHIVNFNNCKFTSNLDRGVVNFGGKCNQIARGANINMVDGTNEASIGFWLASGKVSFRRYPVNLDVRNTTFKNSLGFIYYFAPGSQLDSQFESHFNFDCPRILGRPDIFLRTLFPNSDPYTSLNISGSRLIDPDVALQLTIDDIDAFQGDVYVGNDDYLVCTKGGFKDVSPIAFCGSFQPNLTQYNAEWDDNCFELKDVYNIYQDENTFIISETDNPIHQLQHVNLFISINGMNQPIYPGIHEFTETGDLCFHYEIRSNLCDPSTSVVCGEQCFFINCADLSIEIEGSPKIRCGTNLGWFNAIAIEDESCTDYTGINFRSNAQGIQFGNRYNASGLSAGKYNVRTRINGGSCDECSVQDCIIIESDNPNINVNTEVIDMSYCSRFEEVDITLGSILLDITSSSNQFNFKWDDGNTSLYRQDLGPGTYCLSIFESVLSGCIEYRCFTVGMLEDCDSETRSEENSMNSIEAKADINFYPNPVSNSVHWDIVDDFKSIELLDLNGSKLKILDTQRGQADLSNLNSGIYFIQTKTNDNKVQTHKIVKQ